MCKLCETNPVYEFTNKRKLCERCFINYFNKKFLLGIRKYHMISKGDKIYYFESKNFKTEVLKNILNFFKSKFEIEILKIKNKEEFLKILKKENKNKKKIKLALNSSIDSESQWFLNKIIYGKTDRLNNLLPVFESQIKPLYLFLDEEILLYGKLNNFFSNNNYKERDTHTKSINQFLNELEKSHPEVKRAVINSLLKIENKN
jgi:hypothetical protein